MASCQSIAAEPPPGPHTLNQRQTTTGRLSYASASSLPVYEPNPDYVDIPATPPQSICFDSGLATPKRERHEGTGLPWELDLLIAQSGSILLASSECLNGTIESREHMKRFLSLDDMLERTLAMQEKLLRQRSAAALHLQDRIDRSVDKIHRQMDELGLGTRPPALPTSSSRASLQAITEEHRLPAHTSPGNLKPAAGPSSALSTLFDDLQAALETPPPSAPSFASNLHTSLFRDHAPSPQASPLRHRPSATDLLSKFARPPSSLSSPSLDSASLDTSTVSENVSEIKTPSGNGGFLSPILPSTAIVNLNDAYYIDHLPTSPTPVRRSSVNQMLKRTDSSSPRRMPPRMERQHAKGKSSIDAGQAGLSAQAQLKSLMAGLR